MKEHVTFSQFVDRFNDYGGGEQFSYAGLQALFDYLEEYEQNTGEEIELDVIALCCEFSESESVLDCATEYGFDVQEENATEEQALEYLRDNTTVIEFDGGIIIQAF
jgi:hypothetical protein